MKKVTLRLTEDAPSLRAHILCGNTWSEGTHRIRIKIINLLQRFKSEYLHFSTNMSLSNQNKSGHHHQYMLYNSFKKSFKHQVDPDQI